VKLGHGERAVLSMTDFPAV
jgi:hypothetical protein